MSEEDEVAAFLSKPGAYPGAPSEVGVIETHAARVFLAGDKAFKIKKPVKLPFLDFSTLERRRDALARELEINRPHAPEIYLRLVPITRGPDGTLGLEGKGPVVEWALEMRQFRQSSLLSEIASKRALEPDLCKALARMVAAYHRENPVASAADGYAKAERVVRQLETALAEAGGIVSRDLAREVGEVARGALARSAPLLAGRGRQGAIRRCHGDLHLGNIVLLEGRPVPFDALEFDEDLATIDVLYDLAFLLMDLEVRGDRPAANLVLATYAAIEPVGHEIEGLAALPLFLALRAGVRAIVSLERARQDHGAAREHDAESARHYIAAANRFLRPPAPVLVAVGGLSGTGKSTLAARIAPRFGASPGALHLRSDIERKRLLGVEETEKLSPEHYTPAASARVYARLFDKAERALGAERSVVVDAVFAKPEERAAIAAIAERAGRHFAGLWLEAPADVLLARVGARRGDASDADAHVVEAQLAYDIGEIAWRRVAAAGGVDETFAHALAALEAAGVKE